MPTSIRPVPRSPVSGPPKAPVASSSKNYALLILVLAVAASSGIAWKEYLANGDLTKKVADLENQAAMARTAPAPTDSFAPSDGELTANQPDPAAARQRGMAALGAVFSNPQFQQFANGMAQTAVNSAYAGLYQQLNLNQEQSDALSGLLAQRALAGGDVLRNAIAQGMDPVANADQLRQQVNQAQSQVDQSIHTMLGDAGFQQYQDFTANLRGGGLGGALRGGGN